LQAEANLRDSQQKLETYGRKSSMTFVWLCWIVGSSGAGGSSSQFRRPSNQTVVQARDRFSAGVVDNLEVIQAQEALAAANESYISSLYAHNIAKVELAHAIGFAEEGVKQYLKGR